MELARPAIRPRQSAWSRALLWFAFWAGIGLLTALQFYFAWKAEYGVDGKPLTFQDALIRRMPG